MGNHFLIATISLIILFFSPSTTANTPVVDIQGNPLEIGSRYYVVSSGRGAAGRGGLTAARKGQEFCPLYVGQYSWWSEMGTPVTITPNNAAEKEITVGSDVSISSGPNYCRNAGVWQLTSKDDVFFINNDGTAGEFRSTFKIQESFGPRSYKIVYCFAIPVPAILSPPSLQQENCKQLDATIPERTNGLTWLSLVPVDNPLPFFGFAFLKVENEYGTTSTQ